MPLACPNLYAVKFHQWHRKIKLQQTRFQYCLQSLRCKDRRQLYLYRWIYLESERGSNFLFFCSSDNKESQESNTCPVALQKLCCSKGVNTCLYCLKILLRLSFCSFVCCQLWRSRAGLCFRGFFWRRLRDTGSCFTVHELRSPMGSQQQRILHF